MGSFFTHVRFRGKKKTSGDHGEKIREAWASDPYEKPLKRGGARVKETEKPSSSALIMDMAKKWTAK